MSAKIYQGFQVATDSCAQLLQIVENFRPWVLDQGQALLDRFAEAMLKDNPEKTQLDVWNAWLELRHETLNEGLRLPALDTDFELVFFPDGDRFLGIAFVDHRTWFEEWLKQPGVSEYGYWDNTDPLEDVSPQEWAQRGESWERVLGYRIPSMVGFTISVADPNGPKPFRRKKAAN